MKLHFDIPGINEEILSQSAIFEYQTGELITKQEEIPNYFYFILSGRAKIMTTQTNGKRLILQFLKEDDLIGELTAVQAEETIKDVIALGETICLGIPKKIVDNKLINQADFNFFLANYIGKKLLIRVDHFKDQQTQELKIRLIKLLLEITIDDTYQEKHTELAEYLGTSYRHYMHTFKFLKDSGLIIKNENTYFIQRKEMENYLNLKE